LNFSEDESQLIPFTKNTKVFSWYDLTIYLSVQIPWKNQLLLFSFCLCGALNPLEAIPKKINKTDPTIIPRIA
jgi:hypothetical protein